MPLCLRNPRIWKWKCVILEAVLIYIYIYIYFWNWRKNERLFSHYGTMVKVKCTLVQALRLCTGCMAHRGSRGIATLSWPQHSKEVRGQRHAPAALYPWKGPVPIVQEAGWAPGPVWTGAEHLTPTGIRFPDRPACSQSLYWLRYPTHMVLWSVSLISSLSMAAVAGALSHMKPASARCPYSSVVQLTFKQDLHLLKISYLQILAIYLWILSFSTCKESGLS